VTRPVKVNERTTVPQRLSRDTAVQFNQCSNGYNETKNECLRGEERGQAVRASRDNLSNLDGMASFIRFALPIGTMGIADREL
jgi:hypothetical protein